MRLSLLYSRKYPFIDDWLHRPHDSPMSMLLFLCFQLYGPLPRCLSHGDFQFSLDFLLMARVNKDGEVKSKFKRLSHSCGLTIAKEPSDLVLRNKTMVRNRTPAWRLKLAVISHSLVLGCDSSKPEEHAGECRRRGPDELARRQLVRNVLSADELPMRIWIL